MTVHQDLTKTHESVALQALVAKLTAENEALRASKHKSLSFKVTDKGGLSVYGPVYGLGRFPVTLYRGQWERLIEAMPQIKAFIQANTATLSVKE